MTQSLLGTPVDHRTDIWALGCELYDDDLGQRPFKGQYDMALLIFSFVRGAASMKVASNPARVITNDSSPQARLQAGGPRGLA